MISKSSGKITKVSNADDVEIKYGHIIQVLTDWIDTTTVSYTHLLSFPPRNEAGVVIEEDIVMKAEHYAISIYLTPGRCV